MGKVKGSLEEEWHESSLQEKHYEWELLDRAKLRDGLSPERIAGLDNARVHKEMIMQGNDLSMYKCPDLIRYMIR